MPDEFIISLGTAQDGGYPHLGCKDNCCVKVWGNQPLIRYPSSIAYIDKKFHYMEAHSIKKIADMIHVKKTDLIKLKAELEDLLE